MRYYVPEAVVSEPAFNKENTADVIAEAVKTVSSKLGPPLPPEVYRTIEVCKDEVTKIQSMLARSATFCQAEVSRPLTPWPRSRGWRRRTSTSRSRSVWHDIPARQGTPPGAWL